MVIRQSNENNRPGFQLGGKPLLPAFFRVARCLARCVALTLIANLWPRLLSVCECPFWWWRKMPGGKVSRMNMEEKGRNKQDCFLELVQCFWHREMLGTFRLLQSEILNLTGITHIWKHIPPIYLFPDRFIPVLHPRFFCVITDVPATFAQIDSDAL